MAFIVPPSLPAFLQPELPFGRKTWILEGGDWAGYQVHLIDHGAGRPVFLQHGNPTWSFLWRKVIQRLDPERFRCVAPDLIGLGLSSKPPRVADHSVARHVAAIGEVVRALDLRDAIYVGQDWGGPVVAGVAADAPERVTGLVLANTSVLVPRRPRGTWFHRFSRLPVVSDLCFRGLGFPQVYLGVVQGDRSSVQGLAGKAYRWHLRRRRDRAAPLALARMVPDGPGHPSVPELEKGAAWASGFAGPVALVWGEADPILGRALRRHTEAFPQAPVTRTQAGHFLQEEVPAELARAIEDVAARLDAAPATP